MQLEVYTNVAGCDSIHTLNLTINYSSVSAVTVILIIGMVLHIQVQRLIWVGQNSAGCDSTATLNPNDQ